MDRDLRDGVYTAMRTAGPICKQYGLRRSAPTERALRWLVRKPADLLTRRGERHVDLGWRADSKQTRLQPAASPTDHSGYQLPGSGHRAGCERPDGHDRQRHLHYAQRLGRRWQADLYCESAVRLVGRGELHLLD